GKRGITGPRAFASSRKVSLGLVTSLLLAMLSVIAVPTGAGAQTAPPFGAAAAPDLSFDRDAYGVFAGSPTVTTLTVSIDTAIDAGLSISTSPTGHFTFTGVTVVGFGGTTCTLFGGTSPSIGINVVSPGTGGCTVTIPVDRVLGTADGTMAVMTASLGDGSANSTLVAATTPTETPPATATITPTPTQTLTPIPTDTATTIPPTATPAGSQAFDQSTYALPVDGSVTAILTITLTGPTDLSTISIIGPAPLLTAAITSVATTGGVIYTVQSNGGNVSGTVSSPNAGTCTITLTLTTNPAFPDLEGSIIPLTSIVQGLLSAISTIHVGPASPTATLTPLPTDTAVPTDTATIAPTETATATGTAIPTDTVTIAPTETATATETAIPTDTVTIAPTETPVVTPSPIATDSPTVVPTATATIVSTGTVTTVPTAVPTSTATTGPTTTVVPPTEIATLLPTGTATTVSTETVPTATEILATSTTAPPTGTVAITGSITFTLSTADGGNVPDSTQVCVGGGTDVCQTIGASLSAAAVSPTTLTFADLAPGTYDVTVTNAAPYQDTAGSVVVTAGEATTSDIVLQLAEVTTTVEPTQPGAATPIATGTITPTQAPANGGGGGAAPAKPNVPSGGAPAVKALPNTGAGGGSSGASLTMLVLAIIAVIGAGVLNWRRRRTS
ncbi:MAG TPA: hypothetical protein VFQ54_05095, partial [Thermomicrobiales bacterium]|nr:hypothetical protein [Thermomicrobiales bacterium]